MIPFWALCQRKLAALAKQTPVWKGRIRPRRVSHEMSQTSRLPESSRSMIHLLQQALITSTFFASFPSSRIAIFVARWAKIVCVTCEAFLTRRRLVAFKQNSTLVQLKGFTEARLQQQVKTARMAATEAAAVPVTGTTSSEEVRTYWQLEFYELSLRLLCTIGWMLCFELNMLDKFGLVRWDWNPFISLVVQS